MIYGVVYDIEVFPNAFTYSDIDIWTDEESYFEISQYRDDTYSFFQYLMSLRDQQLTMVGFNNLNYDYNVLHAFMCEPVGFGWSGFYNASQRIIKSTDRFGETVRLENRIVPQVDLFKIHHFDNAAKSTSLKALQVNMRSDNVVESSLPFDKPVSQSDLEQYNKPYNRHDVLETKKFLHISMPMIELRLKMQSKLRGDVLNFNDTKIGKQLLEQRLEDVCYTYDGPRRIKRQTPRDVIRLRECIFPYIRFNRPEFARVHDWLMRQEIRQTKGAFEGLNAVVDGFTFHYGTGGIHGSLDRTRVVADDEWAIVDDDVASLYPSIAIVNRLYPEHLGERFVQEYAAIKAERFAHKKGTPENTTLKLALNGVYGDSNNEYSVFYDPKFTMSITINGQLLLSMLAEWLLTVPTLSLIQINTDGVTYRVHRSMLWRVEEIRTAWQQYTLLDLEQARYSHMFIRDVNNYVAVTEDGKRKLKGAYWTPDKHPDDIQNASPTAWYKNFSADICAKAAVAAMIDGTSVDDMMHGHTDPFDFMLREKVRSSHRLYIGDTPQQKVTRYYIAQRGEPMRKVMPSTHPHRVGQFKAARGVSDYSYEQWHAANGNVWNPNIHTKNHSTYDAERVTDFYDGSLVQQCNDVRSFDWANIHYDWYINEARKLII